MDEYGGLCNLSLAQVFISTFKHEVSDAETKNLVGLFKHFVSYGIVIIQVFAHSYELGTLSWKNKSFHIYEIM